LESKRKRKLVNLAFVCLAASLPFVLLYYVSKRAILNEVRQHAMGVAIATSAGINHEQFLQVVDENSIGSDSHRALQKFLDRVALDNPDVRYIYTMRKSSNPLTPSWIVEYVVDQPERDHDRDGSIEPEEQSESPGTQYNSLNSPELINAFYAPTADFHITADPPYPDLISGYAPIRNDQGQVIGIVGVDVTASTVNHKLIILQAVMTLVWLTICGLVGCIFLLYQKQREGYERISELSAELVQRNEMLRSANQELARVNNRMETDLKLAQRVQLGFLPTRFPRHDRIVFDQYYLTCEILGGDLYDAFEIDQDHVGIYMADVAGHGVSAALVSGLLKMAVATIRQQKSNTTTSLFVDLTKPDVFLRSINNLLVKEMPDGEFITLIYGVFDLLNNRILMASAGHPRPVIYQKKKKSAKWCSLINGMALGIEADQQYACSSQAMDAGDVVVFYTDGLTEAMNQKNDEFGDERLLELVNRYGEYNPANLNEMIKQAVEEHRAGCQVSDDFTILTVEIR